jgi:hypothetical protein
MRCNLALLVGATVVSFTASASRLTTIPEHQAAQLRGGEWCTEHVVQPPRCEQCETSINVSYRCTTTGTKYACQNTTHTICQECILGALEACEGDLLRYVSSKICQYEPDVYKDSCPRTHNPYAHSNIDPGWTCPKECPDPGKDW